MYKKADIERVRILDTNNKECSVGEICLAQVYCDDGTIKIFRKTDRDIEELVELLRFREERIRRLLNINFWKRIECSMQAASKCSEGTCSDGKKCKQVFSPSGASWCECK